MAKFKLTPYDLAASPHITIESELNTTEGSIFISYKLSGELATIDLGHSVPNHARVMKLWEKSCFELFIKTKEDSYIEFNFSPEFEWNCFYFPKKGAPLVEYPQMDAVKTDILLSLDVFHLIVELDKKKFPDGFFKGELHAGITSVIKEKNGKISYWALSHHDIKPNFHDFRSFNGSV